MQKYKNLLIIGIVTIAFSIFAIQRSADGYDWSYIDVTIYTPLGTPVTAQKTKREIITDSDRLELERHYLDQMKDLDPNDYEILDFVITASYNCHGYTWYMSEGGSDRLHIEYPNVFVEDGSYEEIEEHGAIEGDKVMYYGSKHSAVIADKLGWAISKWSGGPLVRHRLRSVPPSYYPQFELKFYRKTTSPAPIKNFRIVK